jgi:deoxyinosine 3'endonuclease (endonuclease V)
MNLLRYLTSHSVFVNLNDRKNILSNSLECDEENTIKLTHIENGYTKLTNNIKIHVALDRWTSRIQTCTSFSLNFNKNIIQENLLLKDPNFLLEKKRQWLHVQNELKKRHSLENDSKIAGNVDDLSKKLEYIAGIDVTHDSENLSIACVGIVIYKLYDFASSRNLQCIYTHCHYVRLNAPTISSFQVFREYICYQELLSLVPKSIFPQLIIFNSHGRCHENKFGLACHVGVLHDIISIGVTKKWRSSYLDKFETQPSFSHDSDILNVVYENSMNKLDSFPIKSNATETIASLYLNTDKYEPVFVSVGHKISMERSLEFLRLLTKLQKTLNDRDEFRKEAKLPFLVNHAHTITKRAIINMEKNEFLMKSKI